MTEEGREIIGAMKEMFGVLNDKIDNVQTEVSEIKQRVTKIETTLENETNRNITRLVDGYIQTTDKFETLEPIKNDVDKIKSDVSLIKLAVTSHSDKLQKLEKAN